MSVNQTLIQTRHNASHYAAVTLMQGERIIYTEVPEKEHTKFLEGLDIRVAALLFKAAIANDWKPALVPTEEPLFVPWPED